MIFWFSFGNQGPRFWRKNGEAHNPRCCVSSVRFPQSAGVDSLCLIKSRFNAAVYQSTSCFLQQTSFLEMLTSFSSRTWHKPGSMTMGLLCLSGQQTRLILPRERWQNRYWNRLVFHNTSAVPQADSIHACCIETVIHAWLYFSEDWHFCIIFFFWFLFLRFWIWGFHKL